jgi:transcriptional regulator with XRE-family HTH domain
VVLLDYRERLKNLRIDNDLEQRDIAAICNVSNKTVSHWETLRIQVPVDCIIKICNYYQISSNYILGLPEYPAPKI